MYQINLKKYIVFSVIFTSMIITSNCKKQKECTLIKIGVSVGLTGKYSVNGKLCKEAYMLWEKNINKKGVEAVVAEARANGFLKK